MNDSRKSQIVCVRNKIKSEGRGAGQAKQGGMEEGGIKELGVIGNNSGSMGVEISLSI